MRIDKYLKVSRLIKRRQISKEICDSGRVFINDSIAKSSSKVSLGDIILIQFGNKKVTIKVLLILDSTKKEDSNYMYEIIKEEII